MEGGTYLGKLFMDELNRGILKKLEESCDFFLVHY